MSEKKVYLLTEGSYSNFHVQAAFTTHKAALEAAGGDKYRVQEHVLYEEIPPSYVSLRMVASPTSRHDYEEARVTRPWEAASEWFSPKPVFVSRDNKYGLDVSGTDHEKVRKVFYDRLAQRKAREAGIA